MKRQISRMLPAVLVIMMASATVCAADRWSIINLDKVITAADRTTYVVPPSGKTWTVESGSFSSLSLPGKHLTAWLTTVPQRDDQLVVVGVWELTEGNAQLPALTIRPGYQLVLYVNGVEEGEMLDTWVRLAIVERSEVTQ